MTQITYQKRDGSIIKRYRNSILPYKIGDTTSMGWKVLNILYEYKDKYYPEYEYDKMLQERKRKLNKINRVRELCIKEGKNLLYCTLVVLVINFLKILF